MPLSLPVPIVAEAVDMTAVSQLRLNTNAKLLGFAIVSEN